MIAALDIGGTKIAAGLVDRTGNVIANEQCPTLADNGFDDGLQRMADMLRRLQQTTGTAIEGIGIACTGPVDPVSGIIGAAELLRGWWHAPIVERLSNELQVPAAMENDADAVALSESMWGRGLDAQCLAYITVGTGIGCGIVRNGEIYRGAAGAHPEVGHMAIDITSGPQCYCGLTGCWESLASGPALETSYQTGTSPVGAAEIFRRARDGEQRAQSAVQRLSHYIAIGLVNVITAYCPDVVLLGGGVMQSAGLFLEDVRRTVHRLATQVPTNTLRIDVVDLSKQAGIQGAAAVWLSRLDHRENKL